MFSIPSIRVPSEENADVTARKQSTLGGTRKPFSDRSVNGTTPAKASGHKQTYEHKKPDTELKQKLPDHPEVRDFCSFKAVKDTYFDIIPNYNQEEETSQIINIIKTFSNNRDLPTPPPPDFDIDNIFFNMPELKVFNTSISNTDDLFEQSVHDVSIPDMDFDESIDLI